MKFIANLSRQILDAFADQSLDPHGYLLSAHRITPGALAAAALVRDKDLPLFADNGTKPLIDEVVDRFREPAKQIGQEVATLRRALGRIPRGVDVPQSLRRASGALAEEVVAACTLRSEALDAAALLDEQLSMDPTDLIAQEDFATACLLALSLERETTGWSVARFSTRNRRSLRLWRRVADDSRCAGRHVYAVLSAMDYNTARAAGRLAAEAGVRSAALGVAAVTGDLHAADFYVMDTASVQLDRPVPRRYVRLAQILRGIADGWREHAESLERFHCLGLGAPALLPVAAAAFDPGTLVTTDATSPIHDAAKDRVFYDPEKLGERATTARIVERILHGGDWPFLSPFTAAFRDRFGHDPDRARRWWEAHHRPPVTLELLRQHSDLTAALPLFAEADPILRPTARDTRIAHNHWVLGDITTTRSGPQRREIAFEIIDRWLDGQETTTTRGLRVAKEILLRNSAMPMVRSESVRTL
jgi:hypothetical protein